MLIYVLSLLVENIFGFFICVVGLFVCCGFNIDFFVVGVIEVFGILCIIVVVDVDEFLFEQVMKQFNKLINVIKIVEFDFVMLVQCEYMFVKVCIDNVICLNVIEVVNFFCVFVVDYVVDVLVIEVMGDKGKVDVMLWVFELFGIKEIVQLGFFVIGCGGKSIIECVLCG